MSITPKVLKNKEFNRETFEDQLPESGRIYDESLNVANEAHLLGAPYRVSTKHTDWEGTSGDTTIGFDPEKLWGHAVSLTSNGTAQPAFFATRFEEDYYLDLTQFKHGYIEFYIKTPDKDAVPAQMNFGLVTDADDTSLGVYASPFSLPSDISNDSWVKITLSLDEFETGAIFGSPDFDLTNIEGVLIGSETNAAYTVVVSGLSIYAIAEAIGPSQSSEYAAFESASLTTQTDYDVFGGLSDSLAQTGRIINRGDVDITVSIKTTAAGSFGTSFTLQTGESFDTGGLTVHTLRLDVASGTGSFLAVFR